MTFLHQNFDGGGKEGEGEMYKSLQYHMQNS